MGNGFPCFGPVRVTHYSLRASVFTHPTGKNASDLAPLARFGVDAQEHKSTMMSHSFSQELLLREETMADGLVASRRSTLPRDVGGARRCRPSTCRWRPRPAGWKNSPFRHGRSYDAYLVTEPGWEYFWSRGRRGVVAIARQGRYLFSSGGLLAPRRHQPRTA